MTPGRASARRRRGFGGRSPVLACPPLLLLPLAAHAQPATKERVDVAHCRYVRERAAADAATLAAPELVLQVMRFPRGSGVDEGVTLAEGVQARAALSLSPTNMLKAARVRQLADADCAAHAIGADTERELAEALPSRRRAAIEAQAAYLRGQRQEWEQAETRAERRLEAQVITLGEMNEIRRRGAAFDRQLLELEGEALQLAAREARADAGAERAPLGAAVRSYVTAELERQRAEARLKQADRWKLQLTAGAMPSPSALDWYSIAELRFNFGTFSQSKHLARAESARRDELEESARALPVLLERVRAEGRVLVEHSRRQLGRADRQLALIDRQLGGAQNATGERALHVRDSLRLERVALEAERVHLRVLIEQLVPLLEQDRE